MSLKDAEALAKRHGLVPMWVNDNGYSHHSAKPTTWDAIRKAVRDDYYPSCTVNLSETGEGDSWTSFS